jgi:hypothetical protein
MRQRVRYASGDSPIGQDGVIRFAVVSGDYRWRVGPEEVLAALRG